MTAQETIEIIENAITEVDWRYPIESIEALENAISAVKKQIPKKVEEKNETEKIDRNGYYQPYLLDFICPNCQEGVFHQSCRPNFCKHCGQALDWSDTE